MKLKKLSLSAVFMAALLANVPNGLLAGDGSGKPAWRLFGKASKTAPACTPPATSPACDAPACVPPACTASAPAAAPARAPANAPAEAPAQAAAAFQPVAAPAMFAAPPPSGEITGESNSIGIRGFGLTIPEMRLELPTVHLPAAVRSRRSAEMRVDGGRAPLVTGAPAVYGHLANAGPAQQQQFSASATTPAPASAPAGQKPSSAAASCTPNGAAALMDPSVGAMAASDEIIEMRRALIAYRQELERVKRVLEASPTPVDATAEQDIPPSPTAPIRRISYPQSRGAVPIKRRPTPERIVEASYQNEDVADEVQEYEAPTRVEATPRSAGPRASAPVRRPAPEPREIEQSTPPNVGLSYVADEPAPAEGLGIWKGETPRPAPRMANGSGKRSSR